MLRPRARSLSAVCLPCVPPWVRFGRVSKLCPPCVRLVSRLVSVLSPLWAASKPSLPCVLLAFCPPCILHVCAMCPPMSACVCHASTMWLPCVRHVSALCPPLPLDFVNSWPPSSKILSHHCTTHAFILRASWSVSLAFILAPKFGLCKRALCLKNCLGSMLV